MIISFWQSKCLPDEYIFTLMVKDKNKMLFKLDGNQQGVGNTKHHFSPYVVDQQLTTWIIHEAS